MSRSNFVAFVVILAALFVCSLVLCILSMRTSITVSRIEYGAKGVYMDVTDVYAGQSNIIIPETDGVRAAIFGKDPVVGVLKHVVVTNDRGKKTVYEANDAVILPPQHKSVLWEYVKSMPSLGHAQKLAYLQSRLKLKHGSFKDEYTEQLMATRFIPSTARVLELGGNIGRNSCIIASILNDSRRLVVMECSVESAAQLEENRALNHLDFAVEAKALSKSLLVQKGWNTKPIARGAVPDDGWTPVPTITWADLQTKYSTLAFDTLVADCEGALYYILQEEPDLLNGFTRVLLENDFYDLSHKMSVDARLRQAGLKVVFSEAYPHKTTIFPKYCLDHFYEVWAKD